MNNNRMQMETKLPPPSQLLCSYLWKKTNEAGVRFNQEDIVLLSRLFCDYVQNTPEGKKTVLKLLGATVAPADYRHGYYPYTKDANQRIAPKDLVRYSGWIYKGTFGLGDNQIETEQNGNLEACDDTGILGPKDYCVQTHKRYGHGGKEQLVSLSNYARLHTEDFNIRQTAKKETCVTCTVSSCDYHPSRNDFRNQQLALRPVGNT